MDHCVHASLIQPNRPNLIKCELGLLGNDTNIALCTSCEHYGKEAGTVEVIKNAVQAVARVVTKKGKIKVSKEEVARRKTICESCEHYIKNKDICTRCGCKTKYKTTLTTEKCPAGYWGFSIPNIINKSKTLEATTLVTALVNKRLGTKLQEACKEWNINLTLQKAEKDYRIKWKDYQYIITWGVKMPPWWYGKHKRKSILYMENGLFHQDSGCWIDDRGWFSDSSIVADREFNTPPSKLEISQFENIAKTKFGWKMFQGGDPDGPIMFACQRNKDAPVQFHYKHRFKNQDALGCALKLLSERTDRPVIVRPHPKFRGEFDKYYEKLYKPTFKENWEIDKSRNVYKTLKTCSALVTINSTLATEAIALGIPVAVLGCSAYMRSGALIECSSNADRLKWLDSWSPNQEAVYNYLGAVMRHQIPYKCTTEEILTNQYFNRWAEKCRRSSQN